MSKKVKFAIIFIIVLVALSTLAYFATVQMTKNLNLDETTESVNNEEVSVEELVITETQEGTKYWEVYAKEGKYDNAQNVLSLKNVIGNFYKNEKVVMSFKAPEGIYNSSIKKINLLGGAVVVTDNNTSISANSIVWAGITDKIEANGNVKVIKEDEIITYSDKSVFNKDFTYFKITGNSKAQLLKK